MRKNFEIYLMAAVLVLGLSMAAFAGTDFLRFV